MLVVTICFCTRVTKLFMNNQYITIILILHVTHGRFTFHLCFDRYRWTDYVIPQIPKQINNSEFNNSVFYCFPLCISGIYLSQVRNDLPHSKYTVRLIIVGWISYLIGAWLVNLNCLAQFNGLVMFNSKFSLHIIIKLTDKCIVI